MMTPLPEPPLSNLQHLLLELFATKVSDETLLEIKDLIAHYFLDKVHDNPSAADEQSSYSEERLNEILSAKILSTKTNLDDDWVNKAAGIYNTGSKDSLADVSEFLESKKAHDNEP